ncbi:hypothetical protein [Rhodococcus tibetensis]|uniref:hypothetical protein n=1 Tax=Rhodococcus tibetensis TaxID=2965064 RepID=UPI0027E30302|nr:hypothetical protein [Rhodococcus sp. FXJ9.536]
MTSTRRAPWAWAVIEGRMVGGGSVAPRPAAAPVGRPGPAGAVGAPVSGLCGLVPNEFGEVRGACGWGRVTGSADRLHLTVDTIKCHLRALFLKFGLEDLPHNQKRTQLVTRARHSGIVTTSDL